MGVLSMKSRDTKLQSVRFRAEEKARKVDDLESMIRDFEQMAVDLDLQVRTEEERTGIKDPGHYAYSTFAKAAAQRRLNLAASVDDLRAKLNAAIRERDNALEDLEKAEAIEDRNSDRASRTMTGTGAQRSSGPMHG